MPRWATGAAGCETPVESPRSLPATGRRRVSAPAPATVRDANTRTTTGRDLCQAKEEAPGGPTSTRIPRTIEVFERKLHPRPLGQGYTCLGATPDAASPPPRPCCPTAGGAGGSPGRADWSSLPPRRGWLKTLCPKGTSHDEWWPALPCPPAGSGRGPRPRL
ncbi:hypothetical protein H6P81_021367 [Aristolochia fimbriata]|uniref:Uncharacterized protein n=1 Tax=Aristolochia fimbriata TaxID=158543 RepID=A0AAV7DUN1_ARIFI|nr:hypothetical protein H6P81_021367 [Aristolochia fimbriata]